MKNDQFAVYRVDRHSEGRDLWHLSYQEAVSRKLAIRIEYYRQMDIRPLLAGESAIALWKRMKESCEVSDVLVLNQNGEIHCYYVNVKGEESEDKNKITLQIKPVKKEV